jgi:gamma-butyrobetaine dioxygenase
MGEEHSDHLSLRSPSDEERSFHWIWLRDSCKCGSCFNSHAKQKYFDSALLPLDTKPRSVSVGDETVDITWMDGHQSRYSIAWLLEQDATRASDGTRPRWLAWPGPQVVSEGTFAYADVMGDASVLGGALKHLFQYGLILISGKKSPDADIDQLCDRFAGFVDRSYFGEFFDLEVKPEDQTDSVAFSTKQLPPHTDIPYYSTPPDFQFLFGLKVSAAATESGDGQTRFVDGLAAALRLKESDPAYFTTLANTEVRYRAEYPWAEKVYESETSIIKVDERGDVTKLVNNPSKMTFDRVPFERMPDLYRAYGEFKQLLIKHEASYSHTWAQGDMIVFDNRRIFHGREEFSPELARTLRGGYFREVELLARARYLAEHGL